MTSNAVQPPNPPSTVSQAPWRCEPQRGGFAGGRCCSHAAQPMGRATKRHEQPKLDTLPPLQHQSCCSRRGASQTEVDRLRAGYWCNGTAASVDSLPAPALRTSCPHPTRGRSFRALAEGGAGAQTCADHVRPPIHLHTYSATNFRVIHTKSKRTGGRIPGVSGSIGFSLQRTSFAARAARVSI